MKGWLHIIASLFLVFGVTTGAMAHSAERSFGDSTVASIDGCAGFSKQSSEGKSDPAKASFKFHGCHGHHVALAVASPSEPAQLLPVRIVPARSGTSLAPPAHSDTFRPPIA